MFIRKFLCEPLSFVSWRDLNQLYSLPHKVVDSLSCFGALNALFVSVRRRNNLCPNQYSALLHYSHVLLHIVVFRQKDRVPSMFPVWECGSGPHLCHGESTVIFSSELWLEGKVSS